MKAEKECERKKERANKQVSKNNKKTGFSKTKNNISDLSLKKKETESQINQNNERKQNKR